MCVANIRAYIPAILISCIAVICVNTNNKPLYGPYHFGLSEVRLCHGSRKWINMHVTVELRNKTVEVQEILVNTTIYADVGPIGFRVKMWAGEPGHRRNLINYVFLNACEHFLIGNILKNLPGFTDECFLKKGNFSYVIGNVDAITRKFYGSQFFYGTYTTHTQLFTVKEQGNFSYVISNVDAMSRKFYGSQFFYGTYTTRTQLFTVKEQVNCMDMHFKVVPL